MDATTIGAGTQTNSGSTGATDAGTPGDGSSFNGTFSTASLITGDANAAITFNATAGSPQDSIHCAADATNLQPASAFSFVIPIKPSTIDVTNGNMLGCYGDASGVAAYFLAINAAGTLHLFIDGTGSVHSNLSSATVLSNGNEYIVFGTYDGATMKLYVNGTQDANTTSVSTSIIYTDVTTPVFSFGGWSAARQISRALWTIPYSSVATP
jgi:hypothetical protein